MRLLLSAFAILLSALSLLGWATGNTTLRNDFIASGPMAPLTAIDLFILGLAVLLWPRGHHTRILAYGFGFATAGVMASAAISLSQTAIAIFAGEGQWPDISNFRIISWSPITLSPTTALALLTLGPAILSLLFAAVKLAKGEEHERRVRRRIALGQGFALISAVIALFVLTGYLYHSISLTNIAALTPMPKTTALSLLLLSLAILAIYPGRGLIRFITNDGPSGQMARFLVPVSIFVPIALGWLRVVGMRSHLYDSAYGLDISTMLNVIMLGGLTLISARKLYKSDQKSRVVEQELLYRATHDSLTGLVNRPVFREQLTKRLRLASRRKIHPLAVFYLDLDGFKQVNDLMGHDAGDRLLVQIAELLRSCTRASDTVARFGGDEFVILFEEIDDKITAEHLATRILAAMPKSYSNGRVSVPVGISIGIATTKTGDITPDEILREADTAMYLAKEKGKGCYKIAGAA